VIGASPEGGYRTMFERSRAVQLLIDPSTGAIVDANAAAAEFYGYSTEELAGLAISDINVLETEAVRLEMERAAAEEISHFRFRHRLKSGEIRNVDVHSGPVVIDGRVLLYSIVHDTTDRRRAEDALRESEARFRLLAEHVHDLIALVDAEGKFLYASPSHTDVLGWRPAELEGTRAFDLIHPDDLPVQQAAFRTRLETGRATSVVQRLRRKEGGWAWIESVGASIPGADGRPSIVVVTGRDVGERRRAEKLLREAEEKYRTLVEGSLAGVYIIQDGVFAYANPKFAEIFGCRPEELIGAPAVELSVPDDRSRVAETLERRLGAEAESLHYSFRGRRRDGTEIDVEVLCSRIDFEGRPAIAGTLVDVTERERSEKLRAALYRIAGETAAAEDLPRLFERVHAITRELIAAGSFAVALADEAGGNLSFPYRAGEEVPEARLRTLTEEVVRDGVVRLGSGEDPRLGAAARGGSSCLAVPLRSGNRTFGAIVASSGPGAAPFGEREKELLTFVSQHVAAALEARRAEDRIRHLAFHDALTDLPNRLLFNDRLTLAVAQAHRAGGRLAVMFLDVDRFKVINDSLGHSVGDDLLRAVASRVERLLREGDTLARLGGDEFILLLPEIAGIADAVRVAEKVLRAFRQPFPVGGQELYITASAGVSLYPFDGDDAETLVRNADIAMYRAKEQGRDTFQLYTAELNERAQARMKLESELRRGLRREEFFLQYQPQVALPTGVVTGVEALVYWRRGGAVVPPSEFIAVAEETGLILPLGSWVLRRACLDWKEREKARAKRVPVAINLSARQFSQPDLARRIADALGEFAIDPKWLDLEITESVAMENADQVLETLGRLKGLGVRLTMDDFGTGYSSLAYLKRFPLDTLKIDRAFVRDLAGEGADRALVSYVIALAHGIGLRVIAEGVETEEQRKLLAGFGCDGMQGFLVSGPVPAEAVSALLDARGTSA
jgi:diguanylate cyclase (GGDEF)-like protein/PAS domain S-box-containing protein